MKSYLDILRNVYDFGIRKTPTRDSIEVDDGRYTVGLPNINWFHDMREGFPLLTTKKMAFKTFCVELEGFIKGITDKKWYQKRGCHIWDEWYNHEGEDYDDLGPIYGYQWRRFNKTYTKTQGEDDGDWTTYTDQLGDIVHKLHNFPYDRRMVCSAWNPNQIAHMALPPCHLLWNVTVYGTSLHMSWHMRSADFLLGSPANIMSYALLLSLLSKEAGLTPGTLSAHFMDCHLYFNQMEIAKEQLTRTPYKLPTIRIPDILKSGKKFSIFDWTYEDVELLNYKCHPKLTCEVVV